MIHLAFEKASQPLIVEVIGREVYFSAYSGGIIKRSKIEGVQMLPANIIKEFPDLAGKSYSEMHNEAIRRFKQKIISFKTETEIKDYLVNELVGDGYVFDEKNSKIGSMADMMAYARRKKGMRNVT